MSRTNLSYVAALGFGLLCTPANGAIIVQDDFDNRTAGTAIVGSTTSDGLGVWGGNNSPAATVVDDGSGSNLMFNSQGSNSRYWLTDGTDGISLNDGVIEFDYRYFHTSAENNALRVQYRLDNSAANPFSGGVQPGYILMIAVTGSDSATFTLRKDTAGAPADIAGASYSLTKNDLILGDAATAGVAVKVRLEFAGDQHSLYVDGSLAWSITDDTYGDGDGFNFNSNGDRLRGFDNLVVSDIPEPSSLGLVAVGSAVFFWRRRKKSVV